MKRLSLRFFIMAVFVVASLGYSLVVRTGEDFEIPESEIIDDDLLITGRTIVVKGKVTGDVWAFAQEVTITGEVSGTVVSGAATINVNPKRVKTVICGAGNINISGFIEKNAVLLGGSLLVDDHAEVGKDLMVFGGAANVNGDIKGAIKGGIGEFVMDGKSGSIDIKAEQTTIKSNAVINGDLVIRGEQEPTIESGAKISGETRLEKVKPEQAAPFVGLAPFIAFVVVLIKIVLFAAKILTAIIIIALAKRFVRRIMDTLIQKPWKSLGWGFLGLIIMPVVVVVLFLTLIGFPFAFFGIYLYSILLYLSSIFVGLILGEKILRLFKKQGEISLYLSAIVGIIVLSILGLVPVLEFLIKILTVLFGAGMLLLGMWEIMKEMKTKEMI